MGLIRVIACTQSGMLAIGLAKPESMTEGTMNRNTPSSACCCVAARAEIISPTPTTATTKTSRPR